MALLQALVNGVLVGGVYALVSVGLTLVFGVMEIVNFAQGEFLMLGMYIAYLGFVGFHLDPLVSALLAFGLLFGLGTAIEAGLVRPVLKGSQLGHIFLTVGLSVALQNGALALFGGDFRAVQTPYQVSALALGPVRLSVPYLLAFGWAGVVSAALHLFLTRTGFGRAMRAVAANSTAATLCGVNVARVRMVAFALGCGLAGLAGAVILPYAYVFPTVGFQYIVIMFTVVVLGGLGNVNGAIAAALLVGVVQSVSTLFFPTVLENLLVFTLFVLVLSIRPAGLLGRAHAL